MRGVHPPHPRPARRAAGLSPGPSQEAQGDGAAGGDTKGLLFPFQPASVVNAPRVGWRGPPEGLPAPSD